MSRRVILTRDSLSVSLSGRAAVSHALDTILPYLSDSQLEGELITLYLRSTERDQHLILEVLNRYTRIKRRLTIAEDYIRNLDTGYLHRLHQELIPPSSRGDSNPPDPGF